MYSIVFWSTKDRNAGWSTPGMTMAACKKVLKRTSESSVNMAQIFKRTRRGQRPTAAIYRRNGQEWEPIVR